MSWINKILPKVSSHTEGQSEKKSSPIPAGVWSKCPSCEQVLYNQELLDSLMVCPKCGHHMRLSGRQRLQVFLDHKGPHEEIGFEILPTDPLHFTDTKSYTQRTQENFEKTGENEAIVAMQGTLAKRPIVAAAFDFGFMGGSMGSVVGQRFVLAATRALEENIPFVVFSASGGARMQEGLLGLMQMAKTNALISQLDAKRIPFVSVLTDPTMGGVSASFAFMGDIVIAEPKALIGFAGPRVIEQTVRQQLPSGFQRAEMLLDKGAIDMVVDRRNLRTVIDNVLRMLQP